MCTIWEIKNLSENVQHWSVFEHTKSLWEIENVAQYHSDIYSWPGLLMSIEPGAKKLWLQTEPYNRYNCNNIIPGRYITRVGNHYFTTICRKHYFQCVMLNSASLQSRAPKSVCPVEWGTAILHSLQMSCTHAPWCRPFPTWRNPPKRTSVCHRNLLHFHILVLSLSYAWLQNVAVCRGWRFWSDLHTCLVVSMSQLFALLRLGKSTLHLMHVLQCGPPIRPTDTYK